MKRTDYISWDEYFMGIAMLSAQRSKDNSTQVGACIVNDEHKIVSVGYNGMPTGCDDDEMPWERSAENELDRQGQGGALSAAVRRRNGRLPLAYTD